MTGTTSREPGRERHPTLDPALGPALEIDALLADPERRILVCCGSGGVGKTTTAAALALRAAEQGRRVVVLTIDPARRLAQAMGIENLDNTPRPVEDVDGSNGGRLDAMMLDMKRTFDDVVLAHTSPEKASQILENPFYQALSSSFAGTQEYMAMERLGQLHTEIEKQGTYDLIVVDTPPSRSALDFLDAPKRLSSFLDSRLLRMLAAPARGPLKLFGAGMGMAAGILGKVLGAQVLRDVQTFVGSLDSTFGGFRERAERTYRLLQRPSTSFLVVAAPDIDALREASYFVDRLRDDAMPIAGLVLNRLVEAPARALPADRSISAAEAAEATETATAEEEGETSGAASPFAALLRMHAAVMRLEDRQNRLSDNFRAAHPGVPVVGVPALATDVHDLDALRTIGDSMRGQLAS